MAPLIDFAKGWPNPLYLPNHEIQSAANHVLNDPQSAIPALDYGPNLGHEPLRIELAKWLKSSYPGCESTPQTLCISGGASQNLARILDVYTDPGYTRGIWMISPTYFLAPRIFEDAGFYKRLFPVFDGGLGIDIEAMRRRMLEVSEPKEGTNKEFLSRLRFKPPRDDDKKYRYIIYLVPTFSNPTGSIMSLGKRRELVRLARETDALLVTDDVYDFLPSFDSMKLPPRLVDIDRTLQGANQPFGNTVSNGSFSKLIGPGVRCGWAEGINDSFAYGLSCSGATKSGGAPSQLVAAFIANMLAENTLQTLIRDTLIPTYSRHHVEMLESVVNLLSPLGVTFDGNMQRSGGFFLWLRLPAPLTGSELAKRAKEKANVLIVAGSACAVADGASELEVLDKYIRLCWTYPEVEDIREGIESLSMCLREMIDENMPQPSEGGSTS
ncbi:MAG: hypothetical protein M1814_000359 [Vezdaea aestivalis]|nr:MAG: hypothetical protein M1814_000359 [Vezdaea aestivalis]